MIRRAGTITDVEDSETGKGGAGGPPKCVYCLTRDGVTREHVVSKCFFDAQPADHIVVPTCAQCNSGTGDGGEYPITSDEEYARTVLCIHAASYDHPAADAVVRGKIGRSFRRRPDGLRRALARTLSPATLNYKGILVPGQSTIGVDGRRLVRVFRKITKGLFFHVNGFPLPADCEVFVEPRITGEEFYQWLAILKQCSFLGPVGRGDGVFETLTARDTGDHTTTVWLMSFYRRYTAMAVTALRSKKSVTFKPAGHAHPLAVLRLQS
jgi:hypothetical protein